MECHHSVDDACSQYSLAKQNFKSKAINTFLGQLSERHNIKLYAHFTSTTMFR